MDFIRALTGLRVNRKSGRFSPHKPVMMLAVLDLALAGRIPDNRIRLDPSLLERYRAYWDVVAGEGDQSSPYLPFFHLRSDSFWHLHPVPEQEAVLTALTTIKSMGQAHAVIDCASLDEAVWRLLQEVDFVEEAAETVIAHWFPGSREALRAVWEENREVARYEKALEAGHLEAAGDGEGEYVAARDAAFRRLVLDAYDYRCAASGWRFMMDEWALVEAAHIVPFSESRNDDPRNGIALSPTFHRLMDRQIIAPGPDLKWHVSPAVDRRFPDNHPILEIDGSDLILPRDEQRHPGADSLEWRVARLRA